MTLTDDLGQPVHLHDAARRIVSLVPSLTEAIAAGAPAALVGATDWCTHPAELDIPRVRGTKNPDIDAIVALKPDVVVCNQEENRELDVRRMRERGLEVWVTKIDTVDEALTSLGRLCGDLLGIAEPTWLHRARQEWENPTPVNHRRVLVPIWRDPWIWVGSHTYTHDVLTKLGLDNAGAIIGARYPHAELEDALGHDPDLVLLPDEPYVFSADDGPEAMPHYPTALVAGRAITWYGPAMLEARAAIEAVI